MCKCLVVFQIFFFFTGFCFGQNSYRFKAEIVTKYKNVDSSFRYSKGTVFYDSNVKKVLYKMTFPEKEMLLSFDTLVYRYVNNKLVSVLGNPLKPEYSIYHFILSNDISDFGLKKSRFSVANVQKVDDLILTKWIPPVEIRSYFGTIMISTKNKRLNSVLIYDAKNVLINRQIFKNYQSVLGVEIPSEILSVNYIGERKTYQIVELKSVVINESGHDEEYNFPIPKN